MSSSTMNTPVLTASQNAVLGLFQLAGSTGYTFQELEGIASLSNRFSPSRIRTAVRELVTMGLVKSTGHKTRTRFGKQATIWEVV